LRRNRPALVGDHDVPFVPRGLAKRERWPVNAEILGQFGSVLIEAGFESRRFG